ncbi:hypothetical protein VTK73DRAFT_4219 [Phialemonium thermophilum]|uniref:Uncharacterized protein n=1 Tax=Phialemonium thermophilum TaxID=223376 RepID=A0ABR3VAV9_9PEZI
MDERRSPATFSVGGFASALASGAWYNLVTRAATLVSGGWIRSRNNRNRRKGSERWYREPRPKWGAYERWPQCVEKDTRIREGRWHANARVSKKGTQAQPKRGQNREENKKVGRRGRGNSPETHRCFNNVSNRTATRQNDNERKKKLEGKFAKGAQ